MPGVSSFPRMVVLALVVALVLVVLVAIFSAPAVVVSLSPLLLTLEPDLDTPDAVFFVTAFRKLAILPATSRCATNPSRTAGETAPAPPPLVVVSFALLPVLCSPLDRRKATCASRWRRCRSGRLKFCCTAAAAGGGGAGAEGC